MYETKQETAGLRGGFRQPKPPQRIECVPASVLYEGQRSHASLREEGARARRQTRTGGVKTFDRNDADILAGKPLVIRWFCYLLFGLTFSGVLPCLVCGLIFWFFDTFECWWLEIPLFIGVIWWIWKLVERDLQ